MADPTRTPDPIHDTAPPPNITSPGIRLLTGNRYELGEEIARGGMGEVYRATDTILNREVAVKVLQARYGPHSAAARRFADEARITGQLQHPAIPPVHDLGTLPDGRPFMAMKLIKGDTLDDRLKARPNFTVDRGPLVVVFEAICQGVAYAHAREVIHRDLKPQNVMVGGFGDVQVMDWGLAKVLVEGDAAPTESDTHDTGELTEIATARDSEDVLTHAGSVMGTPAYMPPEQAIGAVDQIDRRSDVFGLGGILAAILTGCPPFVGENSENTRQLAAMGKVQECYARLDACGADPELVALCKSCLAMEKDDRPADAAEVAKAVAGLRAAASERARRAEVERERATVREAEARKRRRVWLGLATSLAVGLVVAVGLAISADWSRRAARTAEANAEQRRLEADQARGKEAEQRREAVAAKEKESQARRKAEVETKLANTVKDFLKFDVLLLADPAIQQGDGQLRYDAEVRLRDVVLRASKAIDGKFADRPLVEAELRGTLGYTLQGMGRADLAVTHYERVRAIYTKHLGPDDTSTLSTLNNLACVYDVLNRPQDSLKLREETLARMKRKFGLDDPDTLRSMNNLACSYDALKRPLDALKLREETLARMKGKLGVDDPDTLRGMNNLAASYDALGRQQEALKLWEETLARRRRKLGVDHPDTLSSQHNLAYSYHTVGRQQEALKLREETLPLMKQKLGPDHPNTLTSISNLIDSYDALGRTRDALKLREEILGYQKRTLGPDHPETLNMEWGVIHALMELEQLGEAFPRIDDVLRRADRACATDLRPDPRLMPQMILFRARIVRVRQDAKGCRETATRYERLGIPGASALYAAACYRGVAAGLFKDQPAEAKVEADLAMNWLRKAVAAGYRDRAHLDADEDLNALRDRDDFKQLVGTLRYTAPRPRLVK